MPPAIDTVVLDIDGTLVDSVYQHTLAWSRAFVQVGVVVPAYRIHAAIGLGSDRLVAEVAGESVERAMGDEVRERHSHEYDALWPSVSLLPGGTGLIAELKRLDLKVALASSGSRGDSERALELVEDAHHADTLLTGDDGYSTKPAPDLLRASLEKVGGTAALVVGDAPWDMVAASRAGMTGVAVLTGGFPDHELRGAGAVEVYGDAAELTRRAETEWGRHALRV